MGIQISNSMENHYDKFGFNIRLFLFVFLIFSYCLYPIWLQPVPMPVRLLLLNAFYFLIAVPMLFIRMGDETTEISSSTFATRLKARAGEIAAVIFVSALHIPIINTPILIGGDEQSHAGPAAYLLGHVFTAINPLIVHLFMAALAAFLIFIAVRLRKKLWQPTGNTAIIIIGFIIVNLYFLVLAHKGFYMEIGKWQTILRYPPLSKFLYLYAYGLFGIHEWAPRLVQLLFVAGAAAYAASFAELAGAKIQRPFAILVFMLFPSFFNLANSAELEGGTIFFFTAASYHFCKAAMRMSYRDMLLTFVFLATGLLYKRLLMGLLFLLIAITIALIIFKKENRTFYWNFLKGFWIPIAAGMPFILIGKIYYIRNAGLILSNLYDPRILATNISHVPLTTGYVLAIIAAASFAYVLLRFKWKNPVINYLMALFIVYYIMISATEAIGYTRHSQPFYLPLAIFIIIFLSEMLRKIPSRAVTLTFQICIITFAVYYSLLQENPFQRTTLLQRYTQVFPYNELMEYLNTIEGNVRVYAPMETDPSHFYLAKHGLVKKIHWDRKIPYPIINDSIKRHLAATEFDFVFIPYADTICSLQLQPRKLADELIREQNFRVERVFTYHGNTAVLLYNNLKNRYNLYRYFNTKFKKDN